MSFHSCKTGAYAAKEMVHDAHALCGVSSSCKLWCITLMPVVMLLLRLMPVVMLLLLLMPVVMLLLQMLVP